MPQRPGQTRRVPAGVRRGALGGWLRPDTGTRGPGDKRTAEQGDERARESEGHGEAHTDCDRNVRRGGGCRRFFERAPICKSRTSQSLPSINIGSHATNAALSGSGTFIEQLKSVHAGPRRSRQPVRLGVSRLARRRPVRIRKSRGGVRLRRDYMQAHETNETSFVSQRTVSNNRNLFTGVHF